MGKDVASVCALVHYTREDSPPFTAYPNLTSFNDRTNAFVVLRIVRNQRLLDMMRLPRTLLDGGFVRWVSSEGAFYSEVVSWG